METVEVEKTGLSPQGTTVDIAQLRQQVDQIDDMIIQLILRRIELSTLIMQLKSSAHIVDPTREQTIICHYFNRLSEVSTLAKTKRLVAGIIGAAKLYPDL